MCKEASPTAHVRKRHLIHIHIALVTPTYVCTLLSQSPLLALRDQDLTAILSSLPMMPKEVKAIKLLIIGGGQRGLSCAVSELLNTILDGVVGPDTCRGQHPSEIYIYWK